MYTHHADTNVICSMLYQRGERTATNGLKTISRRQVENVVSKYNVREHKIITVREILHADTDRWGISETMETGRFILSQRMPA